jgi:OPA family sugar phosphate sensor protein UhpC-like MFS transporter
VTVDPSTAEDSPATRPQQAARDPTYERWRWQVFGVTWLAYAGFYLTRKSFSVAKTELENPAVMGLTEGQMAWADGGNQLAYSIGQLAWGALGDRHGPRRIVLAGMLASIITAVLMGAASTAVAMIVLFTVQGICQAAGWAPLVKNVGAFFSRGERGRVMGVWCTNYAVGGLIATAIAGIAAQSFGWRFAFWVPAAGLILVWILFLLLQRNRPEDLGLPPVEEYRHETGDVVIPGDTPADEPEGSWAVLADVLKNRIVWLLALAYFLLKPTRYLILYWAPLYVKRRLGTEVAESGVLGSLFELGGPAGVLLGGYVSDRLFGARRMPVTVLGLAAAAAAVFALPFLPASKIGVGFGFFFIGFFLYPPDSLISGTAAIDFGTRRGAGTAAGFINCCGSLGAILGSTLPGWIKAFLPAGADIWTPIFCSLGFCLLIGGLILLPQWHRLPTPAAKRQPLSDHRPPGDASDACKSS